jgi:hypothetical protein
MADRRVKRGRLKAASEVTQIRAPSDPPKKKRSFAPVVVAEASSEALESEPKKLRPLSPKARLEPPPSLKKTLGIRRTRPREAF